MGVGSPPSIWCQREASRWITSKPTLKDFHIYNYPFKTVFTMFWAGQGNGHPCQLIDNCGENWYFLWETRSLPRPQLSAKGPLGLLTLSFVLQPPKKFSPILPKCQPTLQKCLPSPKSLFLPLKILPTPQKWVSIYHTGSHIRWKPFEGRIVDMCVMDTCDTYVCIYVVSHSVTNSVI